MNIWREIDINGWRVLWLPDSATDEHAIRLAEFGGPEGLAKHEAALALHRSGIGEDMRDLRTELRRMSRLLAERVQRPSAAWMTTVECARLIGISVRALFREMQRHPDRMPALAVVRVGRRLRFDRAKIEESLRSQSDRLNSRRRTVLLNSRASSPVKENER